jgi:hypothetical protein
MDMWACVKEDLPLLARGQCGQVVLSRAVRFGGPYTPTEATYTAGPKLSLE